LFSSAAGFYGLGMAGGNIAQVAALVGDPARANMLAALMDGRALTAGELAFLARVSAPTASAHLGKLLDGKLLSVVSQGRHRYYRLASPLIARMLESIDLVAQLEAPPRYRPTGPRDAAMRLARLCYDHLAGTLGVALADALVARGHVVLGDDGGEVTAGGAEFLRGLGIDAQTAAKRHRAFCQPCLDWSERRPHIAGAVGAALARRCFEAGWIERLRDTRAVAVTTPGRRALQRALGIELPAA
jgi:DNA-binding transcriptional ArsR family regulator